MAVAGFLYRLGGVVHRRRGLVVVTWAVLLAAVGILAFQAPPAPPDAPAAPGTQSQSANDLLAREFHHGPSGASAQLVFVATPGERLTPTGTGP